MQIIPIKSFGWANSYALTSDGVRAIVIDPYQPKIQENLQKLGLQATHVLLTHCHFDHVGGVAALQGLGARVYCSEQEKPLVGTPADMHEAFGLARNPFQVDETLSDGQKISLVGIEVEVLLTPGHTAGSCCYLITKKEGGKSLFTGDTLFQDSIGRTDFPTGNYEQMKASLRRLRHLEGDMTVYPGHNDETTLERERQNNPFMPL